MRRKKRLRAARRSERTASAVADPPRLASSRTKRGGDVFMVEQETRCENPGCRARLYRRSFAVRRGGKVFCLGCST